MLASGGFGINASKNEKGVVDLPQGVHGCDSRVFTLSPYSAFMHVRFQTNPFTGKTRAFIQAEAA